MLAELTDQHKPRRDSSQEQLIQKIEAILFRHDHVQHNNVWLKVNKLLNRAYRFVQDPNAETECLGHLLDGPGHHPLVVDHE